MMGRGSVSSSPESSLEAKHGCPHRYLLLPKSHLHLVVTENAMEPKYYRESARVRASLENLPGGLEMPSSLAARA